MRIVLVIALGLAACGKSAESDSARGSATAGSAAGSGSAGPAGRDPALAAVLDAWQSAKLAPSALTPASVGFSKECQSGTIEGLDLLLCRFGSPADAKAAEDQGYSWVGQATGASQAHGAALIVLADRRKVDPSGRTINRLMKLAPK